LGICLGNVGNKGKGKKERRESPSTSPAKKGENKLFPRLDAVEHIVPHIGFGTNATFGKEEKKIKTRSYEPARPYVTFRSKKKEKVPRTSPIASANLATLPELTNKKKQLQQGKGGKKKKTNKKYEERGKFLQLLRRKGKKKERETVGLKILKNFLELA